MRFAFAGIDLLGDVFHALVDSGWTPVKLFTRPCDGIYDHNEGVVARARSLKLPIQLSRIRPEDFAGLEASGCEALVVAGYPWLVKGWEPHLRYGLNVHPSPLPEARGPYPLFRAILDGSSEWGVTAHKLAPSFDTGDIIAAETFPTGDAETHDTLLTKCQMGARRLAARIAGDLPALWEAAEPQGKGSYWPRASEAERTIAWNQTVASVMRKIRAFGSIEAIAPIAGARAFVRAATGWAEPHRHRPGTIVHRYRRNFVVAVADGFVQLEIWSPVAPEAAREVGR